MPVFQDVLAKKDFKVTVSSGCSANHSPLGDIPCSLRTLRSLTEKHLVWLSRLPKLTWTLSLLKWRLEALTFLIVGLCSLLIYPQWGYFSNKWHWNPIWFLGSDFGGAYLVTQMVKEPPVMRETWVWSLGREDPLEEGMATHFSIVAWRIPWIKEPTKVAYSIWCHEQSHMTEQLSTWSDFGAIFADKVAYGSFCNICFPNKQLFWVDDMF